MLIDAVGALVTLLSTACLLAPAWIPTGLPTQSLIALAVAAGGLSITSMTGYLAAKDFGLLLRLVAVLNTSYCLVVIGLCAAYWSRLTFLGAIYFTLEVLIVLMLAAVEWRVGQNATRPN
ncbi:MAG TPA: hypothetical protein DCF63_11660 [Planctomycetaceae bacterium]|nr:hypothetical protein [Planctomycetaceae bacterium]